MDRNYTIPLSVVALHLAALWALQTGLMRRVMEIVVPVEVVSELIAPPPAPQPRVRPAVAPTPVPAKAPAPRLRALLDPTPEPNAPAGVVTPQASAPEAVAIAPVAAATVASPASPSPAKIELPSSDADYLQNPKPAYPSASKRLGEQGVVIHSVSIGVDGLPLSARLVRSSGFERLDQAAYKAVMGWHYTPGKRNGVITPMSCNVPINWVLE
ncbi:MAG: hypothetical protein RIS34_994 [Pseudomonadota bacterium]